MLRAPFFVSLALTGAALAWISATADARGWEEVHQTADDVRVTVGADGVAVVRQHLRYRVVAGHFKTLAFAGLDPRAELVPETTVLSERGAELPARVELDPKTPGAVRIAVGEPRGLGRGAYLIDVQYRLDLVAAHMLTRDGAMWRLSWTAPPSGEGHDGARVVFELPAAPTEPRLASTEQAPTTLATLRREADTDALELVRAHVPSGETVTWAARVDPKAFPRVVSSELRAKIPVVAASTPGSDHVPRVLVASALAALAGALALALRAKAAIVARTCAAQKVRARPLLPLRGSLAPFAYGACTAAGLAELLWGTPVHGAGLVALAMALATHRSPASRARPRGPGRWQPIADEEVLVAPSCVAASGDLVDVGTWRGRLFACALAVALGALAFVLRTRVAGAGIAIPLIGAALVPLFVTGTRAQLPRAPRELASRLLAPARDALGRLVDLAHVDVRCMARFGEGTRTYDEVRLACLPADRIPGLRTIELALAGIETGAPVALPEVLVRFDDGSPAAVKMAELAPGMRVVPGRCPEEKVLRLSPRVPTPSGAARLLAKLAIELEGKRASDRGRRDVPAASRPRFRGKERRVPILA